MTLKFSQKCFRDSWILAHFRFEIEAVVQRCSVKKVFLEILQNSYEHMCQSPFLNKVAVLRPAILFKKRHCHRCFLVNFAKFLRTPFLTEHLRWLLLNFVYIYSFRSSHQRYSLKKRCS